ncbi:hypothetical protein KC952_03820, partial [Candidatus Saccharibacteria bacterium]|nr:hypothetical protein [Candidatus Saccharibacteria bacterium]
VSAFAETQTTRKHPFQLPKNLGGGGITKNMQRVFLVGRSVRLGARRRRGLELPLWFALASLTLGTRCIPQIVLWLPQGFHFGSSFAKIGSSERKNSLHFGQNAKVGSSV